MSVQLDIAALVGALALPLVLIIVLWWFREPLSVFFREIAGRVKSVSVAGFSIELATATSTSLSSLQASVDLRHAGTATDVNDSTLRSFYEQISDPVRIDYGVVDIGTGREWLSSRLYILSIILRRMRGLRAFVFVETVGPTRRRFLGVCDADRVRWRLAARWPRLESALAAAELSLWGHPYEERGGQIAQLPALPGQPPPTFPPFSQRDVWGRQIVNDEGRIVWAGSNPQPAADLLRYFLDAVQRPAVPVVQPPAVTPHSEWEVLPSSSPPLAEYAAWLSAELLDDVLMESLDRQSLRLSDLQGWSADIRVRAVLEHIGNWVGVVRDEKVFDRLIDRRQVLEQLARQPASGS
jgi:hypothetical protein